jgi:hypothetical protein
VALARRDDINALAMEATGSRESEALKPVQNLGQVAASSARMTKRTFVHAALCRLHTALANAKGRMYTTSCFATARAHGHDFQTGLVDRPTDFCGLERVGAPLRA